MKCLYIFPIFLFFYLTIHIPGAGAAGTEDMREQQLAARENLARLQAKASAEKEVAQREATESRAKITGDRTALKGEVKRLEQVVQKLEETIATLEEADRKLIAEEAALLAKFNEVDGVVKELVGVTRIHAKDLLSLLAGNLQAALRDENNGFLEEIANAERFPGMADIRKMNRIVHGQLQSDGAVRVTRGAIVDRSGNGVEADILVLGSFTAAYRLGDEVGFLSYSPAGQKLFALSRLPTRAQQKQLLAYMEGRADAVPIDISRGGALSQMIRTPTLQEQVRAGGPLIWPILAILGAGLLIVVERLVFLLRNKTDADGLMASVAAHAEQGDWQACNNECQSAGTKPLGRVIRAGLNCLDMGRDAIENALQEAILREIPPMERFLSTLGMLAAIAPLLGLLGTVTGMINTFHVITQYGTGDPRMMSGGISVALVTTMLGLSVAIPIMLMHTLLHRAVDNRIAVMEEKAVALVNIVERHKP